MEAAENSTLSIFAAASLTQRLWAGFPGLETIGPVTCLIHQPTKSLAPAVQAYILNAALLAAVDGRTGHVENNEP